MRKFQIVVVVASLVSGIIGFAPEASAAPVMNLTVAVASGGGSLI